MLAVAFGSFAAQDEHPAKEHPGSGGGTKGFTGKWYAEVPGTAASAARKQTFTFQAQGSRLTGSVSNWRGEHFRIVDGAIDGDQIRFVLKAKSNDDLLQKYTGKLSGDEIKMMSESTKGSQKFTVKRAK